MNHFRPQHPHGAEDKQNNLPGQMLNNYFQPAPQYNAANGFFPERPEGETGGPGSYYPEQQPAHNLPPQHGQQYHPAPERIDSFFPGAPNGGGNGNGFPFQDFITEQLQDNLFPEPANNNGNGNGNGGPPQNWPPAPSFPNAQGNGNNGSPYEQQPDPAAMGGMNSQAPMSPPPNFVPQKQQVQTFAVDPGGIRHCMFRFTYIWPNHGRGFWAFPTFLGRNSIAGFRWNGFRWVYFGMDLNSIESFQCM
ncbi:hypothetical protein [Oceanobacillus locisalsi]|uniref:Transporter n=1 Tax=Oceanobacillus locisalsi TaxID=546107 RepID=A0ABW3NBM2_9BACI